MKTSLLATCTFAALLLGGCASDATRTSLRPGPYDPAVRAGDADVVYPSSGMVVAPYAGYGGYGYPGPYYGGSVGYGYGGYPYGYGAPYYGYGGSAPVIVVPPRRHYRPPPNQPPPQWRPPVSRPPSQVPRPPMNPPRNFRDLFPGARR